MGRSWRRLLDPRGATYGPPTTAVRPGRKLPPLTRRKTRVILPPWTTGRSWLKDLKKLKELGLNDNNIAEEGKKVIQEAWEKAGKDSDDLYLYN